MEQIKSCGLFDIAVHLLSYMFYREHIGICKCLVMKTYYLAPNIYCYFIYNGLSIILCFIPSLKVVFTHAK